MRPNITLSKARRLALFNLRTHRGRTPAVTAPTCGDEIDLPLTIKAATLQSIRFVARGVGVPQAAAAMPCEHLGGKPIAEFNAFSHAR